MTTKIISTSKSHSTEDALLTLQQGGLVAFPTDTVYGLGALAFDNAAIENIYIAKNRPIEKAIPILIGNMDMLHLVTDHIPDMAYTLMARFWPGPLTCVLSKKQTLPPAVSATSTVAVRIPNHPDALTLLTAAGPMAVTSANMSGHPSPTTAQEVYTQLHDRIPLILNGGQTPGGIPSTLVDCTGETPVILREGPITLDELLNALR